LGGLSSFTEAQSPPCGVPPGTITYKAMSNLRIRIAIVVALIGLSLWALWPRKATEARLSKAGEVLVDTTTGLTQLDTVWRIPIKEGLDLQGGIHMALEINQDHGTVPNISDAIDRAVTVVRTRIDQFGVAEPVVEKVGTDRIIVELPGVSDPKRAHDIVSQSAFLQFQITDKTEALDKAIPRIDAALKTAKVANVAGAAQAPGAAGGPQQQQGIQGLFTGPNDTTKKGKTGGAKHDSTTADTGSLANTLTGGAFSKLVQPTGQMPGEYYVQSTDVRLVQRYLAVPDVQAALPPGKSVRWSADTVVLGGRVYRPFYVVDTRPIITGEYLIDAQPASDPVEGTKVEFTLNREGGRRFQTETARHVKDYMAIVLDTLVMGRPPIIEGAIGTRGQITMGGRDLQAAQDLALVLRAGALPVPLKIVEERAIGASLGTDSVHAGIEAGIIAVALVVVIMLVYYKFSGFLAVCGLTLYMLYTLAALAGFDAVLTLPGLAGFVLSIGIAVDANVLIFERIREELDHGKTPRLAIDEGFRHAMSAIIDSNVSTVLTAAVLYQYGSGSVRGFAVTLIAGILASMVTSIFVVRTFYMIWLTRARGAQTISI
jgi:preprotein translocase subunit SecD